ncbi:hypothetical protein Hanom_Chr10g00877761 [Helianthus anomalus]
MVSAISNCLYILTHAHFKGKYTYNRLEAWITYSAHVPTSPIVPYASMLIQIGIEDDSHLHFRVLV